MGASELVFITGATGFIGSHVVNYSLAAGHRVKLSIRRPEQEQSIRKLIQGELQEKVECIHIPDFTKPGAFTNALDGVDYVFHLASPIPGRGQDVRQDYVAPAVIGTTAILNEAKRHDRIKLVILVSTITAIMKMGAISKPPVIPNINSKEWRKVDLDWTFAKGPAGHGQKYEASKILAQQATENFIANENPKFKIVTFYPTWVLGHSLIQQSFREKDVVTAAFWSSLSRDVPLIPGAFVHVQDVAQAHIAALRRYQSLGRDYILSTQPFGWDKVADVVRKEYPQLDVKLKQCPFPQDDWHIDTSPAEQDLQIKWRTGEDIVRDVLDQQLSLKQDMDI